MRKFRGTSGLLELYNTPPEECEGRVGLMFYRRDQPILYGSSVNIERRELLHWKIPFFKRRLRGGTVEGPVKVELAIHFQMRDERSSPQLLAVEFDRVGLFFAGRELLSEPTDQPVRMTPSDWFHLHQTLVLP